MKMAERRVLATPKSLLERSKRMNTRYWFASMVLLMISAGSIACGGPADQSANAGGTEGSVGQVTQAVTSGDNIGDCSKIVTNPCVIYGLCGWNWCDYNLNGHQSSQDFYCGKCPWDK
jgi:hypothetical protein